MTWGVNSNAGNIFFSEKERSRIEKTWSKI